MDLKQRLARLDRLSRSARPGAAAPGSQHSLQARRGLERLGLVERPTPGGEVWSREELDPGPVAPGDLPPLAGFFSQAQAPDFQPRDILFLDTETTGLAGGTGTLAFVVGCGWWEDGGFRTRQFFLAEPRQEKALLAEVAALAEPFRVLMSYNGASFDIPLLRTRFIMNRLRPGLERLRGWDLLVPARRIWGRSLPDCRQQTLEATICGLRRLAQDVPGHLIPQVWFAFLREGRTEDLAGVLYHNQRDLVGMAELFTRVAGVARQLIIAPQTADQVSWQEAWALGRICEARGEGDLAGRWLARAVQQALAAGGGSLAEPLFVKDALRICKRTTRTDLVARILRGALQGGLTGEWLHREAAIHFEHRAGDFQSALDHAVLTGENRRIIRLRRRLAAERSGA